ncbi:aldo/keto reductase [Rhodococcus sp. NPDC057529]|uniref:aldo/keto reductase n=1 Tax=Rhodococcus sp. NPDC057529 TaxID=3346158 RepID=UPI0036729496
MSTTNPLLMLNNGVQMPALGLGVYQSAPEQTVAAVQAAIAVGYRLFDTAAAYGNEREVGEGIRASGADRSEVFVTTKLWISDYGYDGALKGFDGSLRRLGLDYVDLYLLHWPMPSDFEKTVGAYRAAEKLLSEGRTRAIGVCNHSPQHLDTLIDRTGIVPALNQVELHPYFSQPDVRRHDAELGVVTQAWSPLGGVYVYQPNDPDEVKNVLHDQVVVSIAERHSKTPAQVVIRWELEHGLAVIPKSVDPSRIAENFGVFDFALAADEIAAIDALDTGVRGGPDPTVVDASRFPFAIDNA